MQNNIRRAGFTVLTWTTPLNFIGKSVLLLHLLSAATSVARLGAIARPDQQTGALLSPLACVPYRSLHLDLVQH
jgi:hypothetical protein